MKKTLTLIVIVLINISDNAAGEGILTHHGDPIPPQIEHIYNRGLAFLVKGQSKEGTWAGVHGSEPGVVGLAILSMLAHGEDPNTGKYSYNIKLGLDYILKQAKSTNGYIGSSMYNHGFATLALAESYGAVDNQRLGPALKKAVDLILTSQASNNTGGWRYSPESKDSDTTISGAQMVALLAARNAGLKVPDRAIERGLQHYRNSQGGDGGFGYSSAGSSSPSRGAIGSLVFALANKKDTREYRSAFRYLEQTTFDISQHQYYYLYYASQSVFQGSMKGWQRWNSQNIKRLNIKQRNDGSWEGPQGQTFSTATSLLSLALNYRFLPIYER